MSEHFETDDSTLLNAFRETRNEAAFTEIVRRHLPLVFHVALRRLGTAALAEEATQHAFARLAVKIGAVSRHPERLRAWLHRTAYFEASTLARKETRLSRLPIKPEPNDTAMDRPEIYDRLDEALNKLPELDRELVLRHCCGGEDYRRMAAAVGKSEAACQKRVERALARLGQGLGGARTAGIVFTAFAATNAKSQAMPAAERVAAAALKYQAATSSAAGAFSGMKLGACAALVLAGGAAGWQPQQVKTAPPENVRSVSARARMEELKKISKTDDAPLAPRPAPVNRTLNDVLETIQAGRFGPLIEFLAHASVADLQAIIAEDDFISSELEAGDHFGTAHILALQRWTEIDPEGAFRYAIAREHDSGGHQLGEIAAVVSHWMAADPAGAIKAYGSLQLSAQVELISSVDDQAGDALAAAYPRIAWALVEHRQNNAFYPKSPAEAELLLGTLLNGNPHESPSSEKCYGITKAFRILAQQDPVRTIARAELIPWPELRTSVLAGLQNQYPPKSSTLAPGPLRAKVLEQEMEQLMADDPEGAIRKLQAAPPGGDRDAIYRAVSQTLAGSDPWRFLKISISLGDSVSQTNGEVGRALAIASGENPQRALALLPEISNRIPSACDITNRATSILDVWMKKEPAEAIRCAGKLGIRLEGGMEDVTETTAILPLLEDKNEDIQAMARDVMINQVREAWDTGKAQELLAKMPPSSAEWVFGRLAYLTCFDGTIDDSLKYAAMISPSARRELLPELAYYSLTRSNSDSVINTLKSLSAADRKVIIAGVEPMLKYREPEDALQVRELLKQLTP